MIKGRLIPSDSGQVSLSAEGQLGGRLKAKAEASNVSARWLASSALQIPKINVEAPAAVGQATDLGKEVKEPTEVVESGEDSKTNLAAEDTPDSGSADTEAGDEEDGGNEVSS